MCSSTILLTPSQEVEFSKAGMLDYQKSNVQTSGRSSSKTSKQQEVKQASTNRSTDSNLVSHTISLVHLLVGIKIEVSRLNDGELRMNSVSEFQVV